MNKPRRKRRFVVLMALAAVACVGFIALGNWQVRRLGWKLKLIHDVNTRVQAPPVAAPGPAKWAHIAAGHLQYLHVRLAGHFLPGEQTLVHGGSAKGYGYWVMAPFKTDRGFTVLVNRGYIPDDLPAKQGHAQIKAPSGDMTLTGLLRHSVPGGGFLRPNKPAAGQWYSRDVKAIAKTDRLQGIRVAPYFVDADAGQGAHQLPIGGLTKIHFYNHHLGYAVTWYLLALGCLVGAGIAWRQERHSRPAGDASSAIR